MLIFRLAVLCLFLWSKIISLHLSAFVTHQPGAFIVYVIMYCTAFLLLLFFPSTADWVLGNNPQTDQITIYLFTAFKNRNIEFGSVKLIWLFLRIWTDIGRSQSINWLLHVHELPTIKHCSPEIYREYIVLSDICCSFFFFFIPEMIVIPS